jgi:hypothetical protein
MRPVREVGRYWSVVDEQAPAPARGESAKTPPLDLRLVTEVLLLVATAVAGQFMNGLKFSGPLLAIVAFGLVSAVVLVSYASPRGTLRKYKQYRWLAVVGVASAAALPVTALLVRQSDPWIAVLALAVEAAVASSVLLVAGLGLPAAEAPLPFVSLLIGVAALLLGVAVLQSGSVLFGVAFLLVGVAFLLAGVAVLQSGSVLFGVVALLAGVAFLLFGVATLLRTSGLHGGWQRIVSYLGSRPDRK